MSLRGGRGLLNSASIPKVIHWVFALFGFELQTPSSSRLPRDQRGSLRHFSRQSSWSSGRFQCRVKQRSPFYAVPDYTDGKVLLVFHIRGNRFTQEDFDKICEEHWDGIARIKDIASYCFDL